MDILYTMHTNTCMYNPIFSQLVPHMFQVYMHTPQTDTQGLKFIDPLAVGLPEMLHTVA